MFTLAGRTDRLGYLGTSILAFVLFFAAAWLIGWLQEGSHLITQDQALLALILPLAICFYIWMAVGVRRCHDLGWSGWWILLRAVPGANIIQAIYLLFAPGQPDENRFGT